MADPLSAAASIVALSQVSNAVLTSCYRYIGQVKSAETDVAQVISAVGSLTAILGDLEQLLVDHGSELSSLKSLEGRHGPLATCLHTLEQLRAKLEPASKASSIRRRLLWPFESKKVQEILQDIQKQKEIFQLALAGDSTRIVAKSGSTIPRIHESVRRIEDQTKREKIFTWYKSTDPEQNHLASRDKHEPGTANWIFETEAFLNWKSIPAESLWLYGTLGCGKTILCSNIIDHMKEYCQNHPETRMAYYYFDFSDSRKQTIDGLLRSIIVQLSKQGETLPDQVAALFEKCQNVQQAPTLNELSEVVFSLLDDSHPTYLVIDALDECQFEERDKFFKILFEENGQAAARFNILMTSRQEPDIETALKNVVIYVVPIKSGIVDADVRIYVKKAISTHPKLKKWHQDMQHEIEDSIVNGAQGMFRWATCQLEVIKNCLTPAMTRKELKQMPKSLDDTYDRILRDLPELYESYVKAALTWLAFSLRPVTLHELAEAVVVNVENKSFNPNDDRLRDPMDVLDLCSSLVTLSVVQLNDVEWVREKREIEGKHMWQDHAVVVLAHYSVKEYIISDRLRSSSLSHFHFTENFAHQTIAQICLIYLLCFNNKQRAIHLDFEEFPLLAYAGRFWHKHWRFSQATDDSEELSALVQELLDPEDPGSFINWLNVYDPDTAASQFPVSKRYDKGKSADAFPQPLYYAALLGDEVVATSLLENGAKINAKEGDCGSPLAAAASQGHDHMVHLFLAHGANVNNQGGKYGNALQAAAAGGSETAVRYILEAGADVNVKGGEYGTALIAAAANEYPAIISLLLAKGADVDIGNRTHGKALCAAASSGDTKMVLILLGAGADINDSNEDEGTALYAASKSGAASLVLLLLRRGADVNKQSGDCASPLQVAASQGHLEVVRILLKAGADLNALGGKYGDALQAAVESWNMDVLQLLLAHGADINHQGGVYKSALGAAVTTGNVLAATLLLEKGAKFDDEILLAAVSKGLPYVVQCLLQAGANVNAHSGEDGSALQLAIEMRLEEVISALLAQNPDINAKGGRCGNALQAAVSEQLYDVAMELLERGADVNTQGGYYGTAMQAACAEGHLDMAIMLLDNGADVNSKGGWYGSPLIAACGREHKNVIEFLLRHGADVNAEGHHEGTALQALAKKGNEDLIKLLIRNGAKINGFPGEDGNTLEYAIESKKEEIVRFFLENGADVDGSYDNPSKKWESPLCKAVRFNQTPLITLLLDHGADVNGRGGYGSALQTALTWHDCEAVNILLERGADVNSGGGTRTVLHQAIISKEPVELIQRLLDAGADVNAPAEIDGTPLMVAAKRGDKELASLLIDYGADIDQTVKIFGGALQMAAQEGDIEMVQLFLDRGADVNASSVGGHTNHALMGAVRNNFQTIARLLLDHGADVNVQGGYIFDQAAAQGDTEVLSALLDAGVLEENRQRFLDQSLQSAARWGHPIACTWLIQQGANVNYEGGKYGSALQAAVSESYWPRHDTTLAVARLLLDNGADVNLAGGNDGSALMAATCNTNGEIVKLLVDSGANVHVRGGELDSILQAVARHATASTVQWFVNLGADPLTVGGKYGTALQAASYKHNVEAMKLLIERGADVTLNAGKYGSCLQAAAFKKGKSDSKSSIAAMGLLLQHGADVNARGGKYGSALQCAARHGNLEGVEFLLQRGGDVLAEGGKLGTALKAAENQKQYHVVTYLERYIHELETVSTTKDEKATRAPISTNRGSKPVPEIEKPVKNPGYRTKALMFGSTPIMVTSSVEESNV